MTTSRDAPLDAQGPGAGVSVTEPLGAKDLEDIVSDLGLLPWADMIFALAAPAVRLVPVGTTGTGTSRGSTRAGGWPDLPLGTTWPASKDRHPLAFVLQVDLADVSGAGVDCGLPGAGLLSVFHDARGGDVTLLYAPAGADLRHLRAPGIRDGRVAPSLPAGGSYGPQPLQATLTLSLPSDLADQIDLDDEAVGTLLATVAGPGPLHRIGGHPLELAGDPLAQAAAERRTLLAADLAFLLQIDTAPGGPEWGDDGIAYVALDGSRGWDLARTVTVVQTG